VTGVGAASPDPAPTPVEVRGRGPSGWVALGLFAAAIVALVGLSIVGQSGGRPSSQAAVATPTSAPTGTPVATPSPTAPPAPQPGTPPPLVAVSIGPVATCPPRSTPDEPGPVDQARPVGAKNMAFDRRAGRLVVVVVGVTEPVETWTFDVCTNTWSRMHPNREPPDPAWKPLVDDVDSDLTLESAYGPDGAPPVKVWAYDLGADTWTEKVAPTDLTLRAYDPLSGLVVATKDLLDGTGQPERWTYDVETDTWTLIDRANGPVWHAVLTYDASVDRIVAYSPPETWLFDIRTGTWSRSGSETPVVEPNWAVPTITYDESAERTVVTGSAGMAAYDAAADRWEVLAQPGELYPNPTVYDPVNGRLVGFGWEGDVVAFDLETREWTVLLEASAGQPAP
jgi:hypothetical protein